jgi:8-oxo-dGTP pyrophosphatase MutT (NUDIX family)
MTEMERVGGRLVFRGEIFSVREDVFRFEDGETAERQIVLNSPAAAVVAHDDETLYMVRQPREAIGDPALLEIPAGKLDHDETPLDAAKRELEEEIGRTADDWRHLKSFWASPGFASEQMHLYLATGLHVVDAHPDEGERIELVEVPLAELGSVIDEVKDAKTLIGLTMLREILRAG